MAFANASIRPAPCSSIQTSSHPSWRPSSSPSAPASLRKKPAMPTGTRRTPPPTQRLASRTIPRTTRRAQAPTATVPHLFRRHSSLPLRPRSRPPASPGTSGRTHRRPGRARHSLLPATSYPHGPPLPPPSPRRLAPLPASRPAGLGPGWPLSLGGGPPPPPPPCPARARAESLFRN